MTPPLPTRPQEKQAPGLADAVDSLWKFQLRREHAALLEQTKGFSDFIAEARDSNRKVQQRLDGLQSIIEKLASEFREVVEAVAKKRNELEGRGNAQETAVTEEVSTAVVVASNETIEVAPVAGPPPKKTRRTTRAQSGVRRSTRASTSAPHPSSEASTIPANVATPAARNVKKPKEMPPIKKKRVLISDEDIAAGILM